jgi:hypothetical protein
LYAAAIANYIAAIANYMAAITKSADKETLLKN